MEKGPGRGGPRHGPLKAAPMPRLGPCSLLPLPTLLPSVPAAWWPHVLLQAHFPGHTGCQAGGKLAFKARGPPGWRALRIPTGRECLCPSGPCGCPSSWMLAHTWLYTLLLSCECHLASHPASRHQPSPIPVPSPSSGTTDRHRPGPRTCSQRPLKQQPAIFATEEGRREPGRRSALCQGGWSSEQTLAGAGEWGLLGKQGHG